MSLKLTSVNILAPGADDMFVSYINKKFLEVFEPELRFARFAEPSINQKGYDSVTWLKPDRMNLTPAQAELTPGETPSSSATTIDTIKKASKEYGIYSIITNELEQNVGAGYQIATMVAQRISENMARIIDRVIQDEVLDNAQDRFFAATTSGGVRAANRAALTANNVMFGLDFAEGSRRLKEKFSPKRSGGYYASIIHPNVLFNLRTELTLGAFLDLNKYKRPERVDMGVVGAYQGVTIYESAFVKTYASTVTVYPTIMFGKEAYGGAQLDGMKMFYHDFSSGGTADPLNQRMTVGARIAFASTILQQDSIVVLESAGA